MNLETLTWTDHPENPLIEPSKPDWMIADPSVVTPADSPDGRWHLFANGIILGIQHFASDDGVHWTREGKRLFLGIRPYLFKENDVFFLFYEKGASLNRSVIAVRKSRDLKAWSEPVTVLEPSLAWEGKGLRTNGNPCLVKHQDRYRLYFSAGWVFLKDCLFLEPKYIGVAEADAIDGPYRKHPDFLIGPSHDPFFRNLGAGSMKVIPPDEDGTWYAFNNGIYKDAAGKSRSEIHLLKSEDGYAWRVVSKQPLLAPTDSGWKRALVYAMHVVNYGGEWRMYYNARDGWFIGKERIGLAVGKL
ncbi:MAG: glycosyl hydrolase family 43 [Myxococcales bacterium]|nr:MAG: glycosyl hydrolase family 43 [Myxococcales bacterium]